MSFLLGYLLGIGVATVIFWWLFGRRKAEGIVVDAWWLENEARWASLRDILIKEREGTVKGC